MTTSEIATVLAWHDALNEGDLDTLEALSSDDIDIGDENGARQGHRALRRWAEATGLIVEPGRMYVRDGVVVVEQRVSDESEAERTVASAFRVVHDKVTSVFAHEDLEAALEATEMTEDDLTVDV